MKIKCTESQLEALCNMAAASEECLFFGIDSVGCKCDCEECIERNADITIVEDAFTLTVVETTSRKRTVTVNAHTKEEAREKAMKMYTLGEIDMDSAVADTSVNFLANEVNANDE